MDRLLIGLPSPFVTPWDIANGTQAGDTPSAYATQWHAPKASPYPPPTPVGGFFCLDSAPPSCMPTPKRKIRGPETAQSSFLFRAKGGTYPPQRMA